MSARGKFPRIFNSLRATLAEDFERNPFWDSRLTLGIWRLGQVADDEQGLGGTVLRRVHWVCDRFWVRGVIGAELPRAVHCGPGVRLPHAGRGIILHPSARIGGGVTIYHRVTVGVSGTGRPPIIEDGVYLGTGATVIGEVTIGRGAKIGAGAVVVHDVPAGRTAVGVPAVVRARTDRSTGTASTGPAVTASE